MNIMPVCAMFLKCHLLVAVALFSLKVSALMQNAKADGADEGSPYTVTLQRELYPIRRNGKILSHRASYSGLIHVGTPIAQEFRVVFDTGSGHVVLPSTSCRTKSCEKHRRYDESLSQKALAVNLDGSLAGDERDSVTIGYGIGQIQGEFARDVVCVGPAPNGDAKQSKGPCTEVTMVTATAMSDRPFEQFNFDGIVGLGLDSLALSKQFSLFELLSTGKELRAPQFGFFLTEHDDGEDSELAFGGHNSKRLLEPLSWVPLARPEQGYWQVEVKAVYIDGHKLDLCGNGTCHGILDTGTSHLGVPAAYSSHVTSMLSQQAGQLKDCRLAKAPRVDLELPGFNLTLHPQNYMRRLPLPADMLNPMGINVAGNATNLTSNSTDQNVTKTSSSTALATRSESEVENYCTPKIWSVNMPAVLGAQTFILGEPILYRYYTVFDWASRRAGFGLAAHGDQAMQIAGDVGITGKMMGAARARSEHGTDDLIVMLQVTILVRKESATSSPARLMRQVPFCDDMWQPDDTESLGEDEWSEW